LNLPDIISRINAHLQYNRDPWLETFMDFHRKYAQFLLEKSLRERILSSTKKKRSKIVSDAYNELFASFPDHNVFDILTKDRVKIGRLNAGLVSPLLPATARILEVGCGRGDTIHALAAMGFSCWGIEVSDSMVNLARENGSAAIIRGTADQLNFEDGFFDCVFSQEVIEHLHPDDLPKHVQEAFRVLRPNGIFSVETPNRTTGPQDVSRGISKKAQGLHLKEYSVIELLHLLRNNGFIKVQSLLAPQFVARRSPVIHHLSRVPAEVKAAQDILLDLIPSLTLKSNVGKALGLDDIFIFAFKPLKWRF
jgi:2-polyprenyl-3-methyl-5-hydroxy-6-metoxy-1,4-benzoquinol methylase